MTRRADLPDLDQQAVAVAIVINIFDELKMARGQAFDPVFFARARPKAGLSFLERASDRFQIHIRQHQDIFGFYVLDDRGDKALIVEFQSMQSSGC